MNLKNYSPIAEELIVHMSVTIMTIDLLVVKTCGVGACTWLQAVLSYGLPKFLKNRRFGSSFSPDK